MRSGFTGGSSVGPYSETSGDPSFQPPIYNGGVRMTAVALGGATPTAFTITAGCLATASFRLDGVGSIGGNCGSTEPEIFPPNAAMPAGFVPGTAQQRDLFANSGFESDFASWTASGGWIVSTSAPFAGTRHAQLSQPNGTPGDLLAGNLFQPVTVPSGITGAAVLYQLSVDTEETTTTDVYDTLTFEVRDAGGSLLGAGPPHSNLNAGGYRLVGWNLASFAGQSLRINFDGFTDEIFPTRFRLDDVRFVVEANPPWSVAADQADEGVYSLKSGLTPDGFRSDLVHAATFVAGNVSFARRVSSQAGSDFLRFYVDDVQQGEWSGEVDWSTLTFPVAAGARTLRWSYQKDAAGSAGGDAAWIDSVVLPGIQGASYLVTVSKSGMGSGTVTSAPAGIDCGSTCSASFAAGNVTLTAAPGAGSTFASWTGACAGQGAACSLALNAAASTTAVFDLVPADTTPNAFSFTDATNVAPGSVQTSNAITVGGINAPAAISVTGGTYSVGCTGTFTASSGTIADGQTACVRHTASAGFSSATSTTLTIIALAG